MATHRREAESQCVTDLACARHAHQNGNKAMRDVEVAALLRWMLEVLLQGHDEAQLSLRSE
jgi:hypothetical protein